MRNALRGWRSPAIKTPHLPEQHLLEANRNLRDLLEDKEETSHVFKIFESLPSKHFPGRVRRLTLSEEGEKEQSPSWQRVAASFSAIYWISPRFVSSTRSASASASPAPARSPPGRGASATPG